MEVRQKKSSTMDLRAHLAEARAVLRIRDCEIKRLREQALGAHIIQNPVRLTRADREYIRMHGCPCCGAANQASNQHRQKSVSTKVPSIKKGGVQCCEASVQATETPPEKKPTVDLELQAQLTFLAGELVKAKSLQEDLRRDNQRLVELRAKDEEEIRELKGEIAEGRKREETLENALEESQVDKKTLKRKLERATEQVSGVEMSRTAHERNHYRQMLDNKGDEIKNLNRRLKSIHADFLRMRKVAEADAQNLRKQKGEVESMMEMERGKKRALQKDLQISETELLKSHIAVEEKGQEIKLLKFRLQDAWGELSQERRQPAGTSLSVAFSRSGNNEFEYQQMEGKEIGY